jgi:choline dehydrogenase-like flavoprotein
MQDHAGRTFDAVIVGSGASGGWAAKRLTEAGLRVAIVEAGRALTDADYKEHVPAFQLKYRDRAQQWLERRQPRQATSYAVDEWNFDWFVDDLDEPYVDRSSPEFLWVRPRIVGGRTNVWGRQSYRLSDLDFKAASRDGHGVDWPITYADLEPYYDIVERYVGIQGMAEGLPELPDGRFQPPFGMNCAEVALRTRLKEKFGRTVTQARTANITRALNGRQPCHYCGPCERGCVTHSYFNAAFTTVPDALATGRCTLVTNAMVAHVLVDRSTHRARGVQYVDRLTRQPKEIFGRVVLLCAQALESARILLNSRSEQDAAGLANSSGLLGKYLMTHFADSGASGDLPEFAVAPTLNEPRRPSGLYMPRFRNLPGQPPSKAFLRGYGYQAETDAAFDFGAPGFGAAYKGGVARPRALRVSLQGFAECLPYAENGCTIDPDVVDAYGIPVLRVHLTPRENERALLEDAANAAAEMLDAAGAKSIRVRTGVRGTAHEIGTARMGTDARTSVLTPFLQTHDVSNLFVMDGSAFPSSACQNPTITIMALAVRACDHLLEQLKRGEI